MTRCNEPIASAGAGRRCRRHPRLRATSVHGGSPSRRRRPGGAPSAASVKGHERPSASVAPRSRSTMTPTSSPVPPSIQTGAVRVRPGPGGPPRPPRSCACTPARPSSPSTRSSDPRTGAGTSATAVGQVDPASLGGHRLQVDHGLAAGERPRVPRVALAPAVSSREARLQEVVDRARREHTGDEPRLPRARRAQAHESQRAPRPRQRVHVTSSPAT